MLIACHCVTDFLKHHYNTLLSICQYFLKTDSSPKGRGKGAMVKGECFLPLKTQKSPRNQGLQRNSLYNHADRRG